MDQDDRGAAEALSRGNGIVIWIRPGDPGAHFLSHFRDMTLKEAIGLVVALHGPIDTMLETMAVGLNMPPQQLKTLVRDLADEPGQSAPIDLEAKFRFKKMGD